MLGSSSPLEAILTLSQSRFRDRPASFTATDYEGMRWWLTADFPETFDLVEDNAPTSIQSLLKKTRDIFTSVYLSLVCAGGKGIKTALGDSLAIPSTQELHALRGVVDLEDLLRAFMDDRIRCKAKELVSFSDEKKKAFPLFSLPALAARDTLILVQSLDRSEFAGLRPLLEAISTGSMMVTSACSREEKADSIVFTEMLRRVLGDTFTPAEAFLTLSLIEAESLCWVKVASNARNCLMGYPFRARTVVGFLFLEWFDVANWRLSLLAPQGVVTVQEADKAFIMA